MAAFASTGKCRFCNAVFTRGAMTKHLKSCKAREATSAVLADKQKSKLRQAKIYHVIVEGRHEPDYWLHLEAPADATLADLDETLRDVWLECCGHLSAFRIKDMSYSTSPMREFGDKAMRAKLGNVLTPGMKFYHEYDFGTTTHLTLKVASEREGEVKGKSIEILARNDPPHIICNSCGKPAVQVCTECLWSNGGWLCEECAAQHECGEEMLLPVVNSPRVGMCGYTGDAL